MIFLAFSLFSSRRKDPKPAHVPESNFYIENNRKIHLYKDVKKLQYNYSIFKGCQSVPESMKQACEKYKSKPCVRYRRVKKISTETEKREDGGERKLVIPHFYPVPCEIRYEDYWKKVVSYSDGLKVFARLRRGDKVGIYLETRYEWFLTALSCWRHGLVIVTAYDTLGFKGIKKIIQETEITCLVTTKSKLLPFTEIRKRIPHLEYVVLVEESGLIPTGSEEEVEKLKRLEPELESSNMFRTLSFDGVLAMGERNVLKDIRFPKGDDVASIMYTSGTTGDPKGVIHSHSNFLNCSYTASFHMNVKNDPSIVSEYLGYLPLSHIMELAAEQIVLTTGGCINYATPRTLTDTGAKPMGDLRTFRPTCMIGVPRVYETIKKKIMVKVNSKITTRLLFQFGFWLKNRSMKNEMSSPITDIVIFNKLKELFGGNLKLLISGGAPLASTTHEFLQTVLYPQTYFSSAWGATETCACGMARGAELLDSKMGKGENPYKSVKDIGWPQITCEATLEDVPTMGYFVKDGYGELLVRGPIICKGYYKRDKESKEVFTKDGFYRTGDVVKYNEKDATFTIIDRKKNFLKLQNGEFVSPESLEKEYVTSPFVAANGIVVVANSMSNYLFAIIVPDRDYVLASKWENGLREYEKIVENSKQLKKAMLQDLANITQRNRMGKDHRIRDCYLTSDVWTVENECVNSTSKLRRGNIKKRYAKQIDQMYLVNK